MRELIFIFLLLNLTAPVKAQDSLIEYSDKLNFGWNLFQGSIDTSSIGSASSQIGLAVEVKRYPTCLVVRTGAIFNSRQSWVRSESEKGLFHELYHFKITEDVRRIFLKELFEVEYDADRASQFIEERYRNYRHLEDIRQQSYDESTSHGLNEDFQAKYEIAIDSSLNELKNFESNYLVLYLTDGKIVRKELGNSIPQGCQ